MYDVYGNPIQQSTANCYVVRAPGQYKFPLVYGNAIKNGQVNYAAFTNNGGANSHDFVDAFGNIIDGPYIKTVSTSRWLEIGNSDCDDDVITIDTHSIRVDEGKDWENGRYGYFTVNRIPPEGGNIVIGLRQGTNQYEPWWWHIWLWPHDLTPVEITNATGVKYNIMPVNLATKYDTDGVHIKNWFYQWGRHTPMLLPSAWNSATDHTPGSITKTSKASDLATGLINPSTFYYNSDSPYNWFGDKSYYNLWDAACTRTGNSDNDTVKTVYDPCPVGFKVPNGTTFTGFSIINNANGIVKFTRYSGDSTGVGFPMSGYRDDSDGSLDVVSSSGYVWLSSAFPQNYAYNLRFNSSNVNPQDLYYRASGFSVRPVEDDNIQMDVIMINFTFNDSYEFTCESGMTWFEFLNSDYYKDSEYKNMFTIDGSYIAHDPERLSGYYLTTENGIKITISDNVIGGHYYGTTCCFVAGTQVTVDLQGSTKNIEDIQTGDLVVSYDLEKQENYMTEVVKLIKNHRSIYMAKLTFDNGTVLDMTDYHPILTKDGVFKSLTGNKYEKLELNDVCKTYEGYSKLVNIEMYELDNPITTYTLAVQNIGEYPEDDTTDNFYANGIAVHNAGTDICPL